MITSKSINVWSPPAEEDPGRRLVLRVTNDFETLPGGPLASLPQDTPLGVDLSVSVTTTKAQLPAIAFRFAKQIELLESSLAAEGQHKATLKELHAMAVTSTRHLLATVPSDPSVNVTPDKAMGVVDRLLKAGIEAHLQQVRDAMLGDRYARFVLSFRKLTVSVSTRSVVFNSGGIPNLAEMLVTSMVHAGIYVGSHALGRQYKPLVILDEASGHILPQRLTCVLGTHGSGKSTLMHALGGLIHSGGEQRVTGQIAFNSHTRIPHKSSVVSVVGQVDYHVGSMTVREVLQFAYALRGRDHLNRALLVDTDPSTAGEIKANRVVLTLALVGLHAEADRTVASLSAGQERLLTLAELLICNQKILLVDGLSAALDTITCLKILSTLRTMANFLHMTVAVANTHVPNDFAEHYDDVVCLSRGKVVFVGSASRLVHMLTSLAPQAEASVLDVADLLVEVVNNGLLARTYETSDAYVGADSALVMPVQGNDEEMENFVLFVTSAGSMYRRRSFMFVFRTVYARQRALLRPFRRRILIRLVVASAFSLLLGALFYQVDVFQNYFYLYQLVGLVLLFLGNQQKLFHANIYGAKHICNKALRNNFFTPGPFILADVCVQAPVTSFEAVVCGTLIYALGGLTWTNQGAPFFWWLFILVLYSNVCAQFVRCVDYVARMDVAGMFCTFYLAYSYFFSGAIVTPGEIPDFLIWVYYGVTPASWAYTSLIQNELYSDKYQAACASGCPNAVNLTCVAVAPAVAQSCGPYLLSVRQMPLNAQYQYAAVGMLLVFFFVFLALSYVGLSYERKDHLPARALQGKRVIQHRPSPTVPQAALASANNLAPERGVVKSIVFNHVSFQIQGNNIEVLRSVSGFALLGELTGLLGAGSGPGKATLLGVLGMRTEQFKGRLKSGDVYLNGVAMTAKHRGLVGFVEMHPELPHGSTVIELLRFNMGMRGRGTHRLPDIIAALELADVQHRAVHLLSRWEKKIVALALELAVDCRVLLCDDVASGLGHVHAAQVCAALKRLAAKRICVATLHQPSTAMLACFDRLLLLSRSGRVVYFGPRASLVEYFESFPSHMLALPPAADVAGFVLAVLKAGQDGFVSHADIFAASKLCAASQRVIDDVLAQGAQGDDVECAVLPIDHNLGTKFALLVARLTLEYWREPWMLHRLLYTVVIVLLNALALVRQTTALNSAAAVGSLVVAMKVCVSFLAQLNGPFAALMWLMRQPVLHREVGMSMYPPWLFALASLVAEWPFLVVQAMLGVVCFYFLVGLELTPSWVGVYFVAQFTLNLFFFTFLGPMLVSWFDAAGYDCTGPLLAFLAMFSGTMIPGNAVPPWMLSMYYISPFQWTMEGLIGTQAEFNAQVFCNPFGNLTQFTVAPPKRCPGSESANPTEVAMGVWACCQPSSSMPVTVREYILNPVTGQWGTQPHGYQFDWWPYDLVYLACVVVAVQAAFVAGVWARFPVK